jgi:uncharacterized protein (DUF302 family)
MRETTRIFMAALTMLAVLTVGTTPAGAQQEKDPSASGGAEGRADYTRSTDRSYEQVHAAVLRAAKEQGFRVSGMHNIAASLRKEGIEIPPYTTIEVCNSRLAAQVLKAEPRLGSLMPCRIAVYQQGERTVVSMVLPSRLMTLFPEKAEVQKAAAQVDRAMKAIVDEATRAEGR